MVSYVFLIASKPTASPSRWSLNLSNVNDVATPVVWFILNGSLLHIWKCQSAAFRCGNASAINLEHVSQPGSPTLRWIWCEGTADTLQMFPRAVNLRPGAYDESSLLFTQKKVECVMCKGPRCPSHPPAKLLWPNNYPFFFLTSPQEGSLLEASPPLQSAADTILHCPFSPLTAYMTYFHNINTPTGVYYCITTLQISGELSNKVSQQCRVL